MIGSITGQVLNNDGRQLLIDVQGVGYVVTVPTETAANLAMTETVRLYTHLHVREDDMSLYGFETSEKLQFFKLLLTVSGVGPKMGLEILSMPTNRVKQAIIEKDTAVLTSVKGLGEKLASRLILELKNKIKESDIVFEETTNVAVHNDVIEALIHLGYDRPRILHVLKSMETTITQEEEIIRYALKNL